MKRKTPVAKNSRGERERGGIVKQALQAGPVEFVAAGP